MSVGVEAAVPPRPRPLAKAVAALPPRPPLRGAAWRFTPFGLVLWSRQEDY